MRADAGRSRRAWLLACGAGMAALAGCSALRERIEGDDPTLAFDPAVLADLGDRPSPTPPTTFPVAVPSARFERHRTRTRELLDAVPERPDLPNGAMAAELRSNRQHAVEAIDEEDNESLRGDRDRLDRWRYRRSRAAEVRGAYRAATGALDDATFTARREALSADVAAFTADWDYRGPAPVEAFVVHAELEELVDEMRAGTRGWPPFPTDPTDAVFRAGELVATTERSRAALEDASALRDRLLADAASVPSHRGTLARAAHRLERDLRATTRRHDAFRNHDDRDDPPFDRAIADTPAAELYRRVRPREDPVRGVERALDRGHLAAAIRRAGIELIGLELLDTAAAAIRDGRYDPPETADRVRRERDRAVANLRYAWNQPPAAVSRALATPALNALDTIRHVIDRGSLGRHEAFDLYAGYAYVRHYAALVPAATDHVHGVLEAVDRS